VEKTNMRILFLWLPWCLVISALGGLLISCQSAQTPVAFKEEIKQALDHYYRGEEFLKKGEFEAAAAEFQTSLGISPRPRVYYRLAQVQNRLNQAEQAMESLNQALKLSPGFREAQVFRQQLITQGYGAQPAREGQPDATVLAPPPAKTLVSEPTVETVSPEAKAEIPAADRTSVTFAETPEPEAPESEAGSVSTPASVIEPSASPEEPASPPVITVPPAGKSDSSMLPLSRPLTPPVLPQPELESIIKQGREAGAQGNWTQAQSLFKQSLETHPGYAELWYEYGYASFQLGQLDESEQAFRKAVELKPDYAKAFNDLGVTLEQNHKSAEALQAYQKAVDLKTNDDAFFNLALLQEKLGNYKASVELYEKYVDRDSSSTYAEFARQRIEKLRRLAY